MNKINLESIIREFSQKKVAVVGDVILDHYMYGSPRQNPEADSPCLTITHDGDYRLGGAANAARNLSSLGAKVHLFGIKGEDNYGKIVEKLCLEANIEFYSINSGETLRKSRVLGARFNHPLVRLDYGENENNLKTLKENEENIIVEIIEKNIYEYNGILMPDYDKRVLKGNIAKKIIDMSNKAKIISMVDPKVKNSADADKFTGVSIIKPNLQEARFLLRDEKGEMPYEELVKKIRERVKSNYAVITCGKEGAITYDGEYHHIPTKAREIGDVSGAGDTTAAALLLSLICGANIVEAMHIANYAAGIAVEKSGTASVCADELIYRIKQEN